VLQITVVPPGDYPIVTVTFRVLSVFIVMKCYSYSKIVLQITVVLPGEYPIITVTFRVLSLFIVMKCYSYSKIVLQLIVVPLVHVSL
jgi:hypothetical protein